MKAPRWQWSELTESFIEGRRAWLFAAIVAVLASLLRWCPATRVGERGVVGTLTAVVRVPGTLMQLENPWIGLSGESRFSKYLYVATRWRLLPPYIGHCLRLPPSIYLRLPQLGAWWLLALGVWYAGRLGGGRAAWVAALAVAGSAPWLEAIEYIQFDGWVGVLLLVAAFSPCTMAVWSAVALGPWVDERFLLFLPLALLVRARVTGASPWVEATAAIPYIATRLAALLLGDSLAAPAAEVTRDWRPAECLIGWAMAWRLAWPLVLVGIWTALRGRRSVWLLVGLPLGVAAAAVLASDYTRTAAALLPAAVLGARSCASSAERWPLTLVAALAALNFALPYGHVYRGTLVSMAPAWSAPPQLWEVPFHVP